MLDTGHVSRRAPASFGPPCIFGYLDHRVFLRDWIDARKRHDPHYSYAAFARAGGCSKAAVSNVLNGARTPRPDTLDAFARAMALTPDERNYLGLLVDYSAAPTVERRREVLHRLLSNHRYHPPRLLDVELTQPTRPVVTTLTASDTELREFQAELAKLLDRLLTTSEGPIDAEPRRTFQLELALRPLDADATS